MHSITDPPVGTFAGSIVEPTDVPTEDILPPTEDILPPILPPTEDILPASDNIPVRFTVPQSYLILLASGERVSHWRRTRRSSSASDLTRRSRSHTPTRETDWVGKSRRRGPGPSPSIHQTTNSCSCR